MHDAVINGGDKTRSTTTAHNAHRVLAAALNDAVREGRVARNVAALVPAPRKAPSGRRGLSWAEAVAILTQAPERTAARWLAAFIFGARQGELLGLRWEYVNVIDGTAELAWSLQRVQYAHGCDPDRDRQPTCGKKHGDDCPQRRFDLAPGLEHQHLDGNLFLLRPKSRTSQRVMPLPAPLAEALKLRLRQAEGEPNPHGLVWTRPDGRPIHPHDDWEEWRDLLRKAGITRRITLHEARHAAATWMAELGTDERVARDLLGHSDVLMTRSYTHISQSQALAALDGIAAKLTQGG
jgi:integrase